MTIDVLMPALSPTMEEGTLAKWLVKEGDTVEPGDVIAEIETDKATMEVEAVDEGTVGKILVDAGTEGVKVNARIAVLLEEGEDKADVSSSPKNGGERKKSSGDKDEQTSKKTKAEKSTGGDGASQRPEKKSEEKPENKPANGASRVPDAPRTNGRIKASPLARRLASEAGIDLKALKGSGPHGRIVKADVKAAEKGGTPAATKAPAEAPAQSPEQLGIKPGTYDEVPLGNIRKTIAQRLTVAKRDVPHYYLTIDCEIDKLLKARKDLNDAAPKDKDGKPAYKISVNDFVIKACAQALRLSPGVNASWAGDKILQHHHADIAMAVAIPEGLITPIIWEADEKGLAEIAREASELAQKAKNKKLMPEEYQGGTFSVSNLGMFGIRDFTAVINPPHAAILAVGAGEQRPVVKNGALAVATVMTCTMSCDHRVVDGAMGAEFLAHFKRFIEDPVTMLL